MEGNTQTKAIVRELVNEENREIFKLYKMWKTLPIIHMLKFGGKGVTVEGICNDLDIDDPLALEVFSFTTQRQWRERFGMADSTLWDWNKKIRQLNPLEDAKKWVAMLTKNVVFNLYRRAATTSDSFTMKLYFQVVNEWQEKNTLNIHVPDTIINFGLMGKDRKEVKPAVVIPAVPAEAPKPVEQQNAS